MKYRSKPVEVEAVQYTCYSSTKTMHKVFGKAFKKLYFVFDDILSVPVSTWIIKDGDTFSVCSDEEFKRKYEACE